jgi:hypothetical protein
VYVSDSGLDAAFQPTGTDAVYVIEDGKARKLVAKKSLGAPNGLMATPGGAWVVTFSGGELFWLSDQGKREKAIRLPEGQADGVVVAPDGRLLISSWAGSAVYSWTIGGEFHKEISGVDAPAGIGFDCRRNRVLIPLFKKDTVVIHTLSEPPPAPATAPTTPAPTVVPN